MVFRLIPRQKPRAQPAPRHSPQPLPPANGFVRLTMSHASEKPRMPTGASADVNTDLAIPAADRAGDSSWLSMTTPITQQHLLAPAEMKTAAPVLTVSGLHKRFQGVDWVVRNIDLTVGDGEILSILGPSGCGKTTLLRLIAGFETPERGKVFHNGDLISRPGWALAPEQRQIGMVFQEFTLFPHLTVRENVQFGLTPSLGARFRGWMRGQPEKQADNGEGRKMRKEGLVKLMSLCGLAEMADRYPHELSGGQQQRVALARALATNPRILLLDEPFSNLDSSLRQHLREEVRGILKAAGATSILVTHDQEEAVNMGDRLAVMNQGRVEQVGTPLEILERPANRFVAAFIGWNHFLPGTVQDGQIVTELGTFPVSEAHQAGGTRIPSKGEVDVLLRPSQIVTGANAPCVPSEVVRVRYLSGQTLYTLALPSGLKIPAMLPESAKMKPGDRVDVRFEPSPLVTFPPE